MFKRIRYAKSNDGVLVSTKAYEIDGKSLVVKINPSDKSFIVLDLQTGGAVAAGSSDVASLATLKIMAKQALMSIGVVFEEETRVRQEKEQGV